MAKWIIILLAAIGLAIAIGTAATARRALPRPAPAEPPSVNPYPHGVAASGIVESATRDVGIAAPEPGLVVRVFTQVGGRVHVGTPLFQLDVRPLEAQKVQARSALGAARADLDRLKAEPRPEDIPPLEAAVQQAQSEYHDREDDYDRAVQLKKTGGANDYEVTRKRYLMNTAHAALGVAQANLARLKAGAWSQEVAVAQAKVDQASADLQALQIRIDRMTVRSPIDGTVLKRNIEPGEYAAAAPADTTASLPTPNTPAPAMVVGDLDHLNVRAQIDENDALLVRPGDKATARPRGAIDVQFPLTMIRIEPLAIPKTQLTGLANELIDTRVVEVLFRVQNTRDIRLYPGQLVDVFVDTAEPRVSTSRDRQGAAGTPTKNVELEPHPKAAAQ